MPKFRATAFNSHGDTFQFVFYTVNWNGIDQVARAALNRAIDGNSLHQKHGPWNFRDIDRAA